MITSGSIHLVCALINSTVRRNAFKQIPSLFQSLVNSNLKPKDINVNIDGGNNTSIEIKGNSSSKESNINEGNKIGNGNSGTQRIISITHGNKNTMTKGDGGGANGADLISSESRPNSRSRSTQRIISVTQPESARNKNKAHGYSVDGPTNDPALKKSEQVLPFFHLAILILKEFILFKLYFSRFILRCSGFFGFNFCSGS